MYVVARVCTLYVGVPFPDQMQARNLMTETTGVALALEGWCEDQFIPLARRFVNALEGSRSLCEVPAPYSSLEAALLEGVSAPAPRRDNPFYRSGTHQHIWAAGTAVEQQNSVNSSADHELQQLRCDLETVILQRAQLRAQLVVECERRKHAEMQCAALCAPSTSGNVALGPHAPTEGDRRGQSLGSERLARAEADNAIRMQQLRSGAPRLQEPRSLLRQGMTIELERENGEMRRALEFWHLRCARTSVCSLSLFAGSQEAACEIIGRSFQLYSTVL